MRMELLGVSTVDFKSADGTDIKGLSLFVAFEDDRVTGKKTEKLFVRNGIELPKITVGETIEVMFDMRGKVEAVKALKA